MAESGELLMVTIYDKQGVEYEKFPVDARECVKSGKYFFTNTIEVPAPEAPAPEAPAPEAPRIKT